MKNSFIILCILGLVFWLMSLTPVPSNSPKRNWLDVDFRLERLKVKTEKEQVNWEDISKEFQLLRMSFKKCEALLWYTQRDFTNKYLNGAPLPKLEENAPSLFVIEPKGLQRMEELINEHDLSNFEKYLSDFRLRWKELEYGFEKGRFTDRMFFEAFRQEVIRIAFTGVTGFETPAFSDAIVESEAALEQLFFQPGNVPITNQRCNTFG